MQIFEKDISLDDQSTYVSNQHQSILWAKVNNLKYIYCWELY